PAQHDNFVAPVELVGFARSKAQRDIGYRRRLPMLLGPSPGIAAHRIVATVIAAPAQFLEDPDQRKLLASGFTRIGCQQLLEAAADRRSFGRGWTFRSYLNDVAPDRSILRTVFRDTFRSRAISLIVLPLRKCSRRIRPIVSTVSIPPHCSLRIKASSAA